MPAPYASRAWDYKRFLVRTVVDDDGGIYFVLKDISLILESEAAYWTFSGPDGHENRPISSDRCQMTLVHESHIKALLRESRGAEAKPLGAWLESVVIPSLNGAARQRKGPMAPDPILYGLNALIGLRAAQLSRDRHLTALAETVGLNENAAFAPSSPAEKTSMTDLIAWCQSQGGDLAARSGTTTSSPHEGGIGPVIDEALNTSSSRPLMHQPGVTDGTFVEDRDEDGVPEPKARKTSRLVHVLEQAKGIESCEIDPIVLAEARRAAAHALGEPDDDDPVSPQSTRRPARNWEELIAPRQPAINVEDKIKALLAITLSKD